MGHLRKIKRASRRRPPGSARPPNDGPVQYIDLDRRELEAILEHAKTAPMSQGEYDKLHAVVETLVFLTAELEKKRVSVQRLKHLLFRATTETTQKVMEKILEEAGKEDTSGDEAAASQVPESSPKAKGHGRNGAKAYVGAKTIRVSHASLKPGDLCPHCKKGAAHHSHEAFRRLAGMTAIEGPAAPWIPTPAFEPKTAEECQSRQ